MDPDRPFVGTTIIDFDMDNDSLSDNSDLPTWLRDMIDRALTATGLRPKRHVASEDALESLIDVDIDSLEDTSCPICYDSYERLVGKKNKLDVDSTKKQRRYSDATYQSYVKQDQEIVDRLATHDINVQSIASHAQFNDPSLFFPCDEGSLHYSRFPVSNLSTLQEVTSDDYFPGYEDEDKLKQKKHKKHNKLQTDGHIPVKMPQCDHVFGKSCVIEWLKNNVSCPLCRKEVEALKEDDPKVKKIETINNNSFYNFNNQQETIDHLINHSTDVFNPYRRPFNSLITPLTDSYMNQDWAIPFGANYTRVNAREPNLVLPRRFPFPESTTHAFPIHRLPRTPARNENTNNSNNNGTATPRPEERGRGVRNVPRSSLHIVTNQSDDNDSDSSNFSATIQDDLNPQFAPIANSANLNISRGGSPLHSGGPERSRRSGRVHPYGRPSEDQP